MSGNVSSYLGFIFPCSVFDGNVTWRGRSVQCCTCFKWVHFRCSLSFFRFKTLGSSHFWSCPPCCALLLVKVPHLPTLRLALLTPPACILSLFHLASLPMQCFRPTLVFKPPTLFPPTLYLLPVHPPHLMFLAASLYLLIPSPPDSFSVIQ